MSLGYWGCLSPDGPGIIRIVPRCLLLCMIDHIWPHLPPHRGLIAGVTYGTCVGIAVAPTWGVFHTLGCRGIRCQERLRVVIPTRSCSQSCCDVPWGMFHDMAQPTPAIHQLIEFVLGSGQYMVKPL